MPVESVQEQRSSLHPSEKELPEKRSGIFHHKNTPVGNAVGFYSGGT
jgi:hypothetical protein